jgi:predicted kinase
MLDGRAIVDAVSARPGDRQAMERVAADEAVPFVRIDSKHKRPPASRAEQRRNGPSDADAALIRFSATGRVLGRWRRTLL